MDADIVVIGGGPVGMVAALYAARAGLSVVVLEPRPAPHDKACGEGLMPGALLALHDLGVDPPGRALRGIEYIDGRRSVSADFSGPAGRGVRRTALHQELRAALEIAEISVIPGTAAGVEQDADSVQVVISGSKQGLVCRYVLAADGLHSPTRRRLGLQAKAPSVRRYGLRQHFRVAPWNDCVEVYWAASAEAYVTPVAEDVVGVAVLTTRRGAFDEHLADFPHLAERLTGATPASDILGAGPLAQRVTSRVCGRILLVGDAGGYVDALTGEGLAVGFAQAEVAVQAVLLDRPAAYPRWAQKVTWRSTALTRGLLVATQPTWGRRVTLRAAVAMPGAFRAAVSVLARS
ncbi:NAD(P)/FAD-dependent oxidoreductase [Ornithinimicrobium sp. Arc0846-15]|nr:NAD(P)/FAD-dependent oxidoreductase [Ornithinimicrobium laminariae]